MERRHRRAQLVDQLTIEVAADGTRYVTFHGVALGRLHQDPESGRWLCERRAGWAQGVSEFAGGDAEHAEGWAVEEIANHFAMEEQARGNDDGSS